MKKLFIVSLVLLVLTIVFLLIYNFVFKKSSQDFVQESPLQQEDAFAAREPIAVTDKISKISQESILAATFENEDSIFYVAKDTGIIKRINVRGSEAQDVFNPGIANVVRSDWSSDPFLVLLSTKDNRNYYLDISAGRSFLLNFEPDFIQWALRGNRVLYKKYTEATGERALILDTVTNTASKKLADLPFRRVGFQEIPDSLLVAFWPEPDAFSPTELFTVSTVSPGDPKKIYSGAFGGDFSFSPSGETILMSASFSPDKDSVSLAVMNRDGGEFQNLGIPTFLSKTVWSPDGKTVYYAQPADIPQNSVLPNDYMRGNFMTRDTFWKVDTTTNKKSRIINLDELPAKFDATNLFLSNDEASLYFINRIDDSLHRLNIL